MLAVAISLLVAACGAPTDGPEPAPEAEPPLPAADQSPAAQLVVYFTRDEAPHPVSRTVAQFESVRSIEYQLTGSCHRFWVFLQYGCEIVRFEDEPDW